MGGVRPITLDEKIQKKGDDSTSTNKAGRRQTKLIRLRKNQGKGMKKRKGKNYAE